jgi:rRNA-processing protein FCF1
VIGGTSAVQLVVDGMNVIGSRPDGWWRDRAQAQRDLVARLEILEHTVTVVFDGKAVAGLGEGGRVVVEFAPHADDRIAELAGPGALVVTSDRELRARAERAGAQVVGASWLLARIP